MWDGGAGTGVSRIDRSSAPPRPRKYARAHAQKCPGGGFSAASRQQQWQHGHTATTPLPPPPTAHRQAAPSRRLAHFLGSSSASLCVDDGHISQKAAARSKSKESKSPHRGERAISKIACQRRRIRSSFVASNEGEVCTWPSTAHINPRSTWTFDRDPHRSRAIQVNQNKPHCHRPSSLFFFDLPAATADAQVLSHVFWWCVGRTSCWAGWLNQIIC